MVSPARTGGVPSMMRSMPLRGARTSRWGTPKANLLVRVINGLSVFANYGRRFQSPFGASLYAVPGASRSPEVSVAFRLR